jgi:23S rRNA (uridine2552-2'-O)-methyltransferase
MKRNRWDDHYARRAKKEKWLARSVFKLQEIDEKFNLIRGGDRLLDLGCYPGSWSQYATKKVGPAGYVVGVDLKRPDQIKSSTFSFIQGDVFHMDPDRLFGELGEMDIVISDLAPKTTGIHGTDAIRSIELNNQALHISLAVLRENGRLLCKILEGKGIEDFKKATSNHFQRVKLFRPKATRKKSTEVYLLGLDRKLKASS